MAFSNILGDFHYEGKLSAAEMELPDNSVDNNNIGASAASPIDAEKVESQFVVYYSQPNTAANIDEDEVIHISRYGGEVVSVGASFGSAIPTGATAAENTKVKLVKQTGATTDEIMTADIQLDVGNAVYTPEYGTLDGAGKILAANDTVRVSVTQNGTETAPLARGLCVVLILRENQQ